MRIGLLYSKPEGIPWVRQALNVIRRRGDEAIVSDEIRRVLSIPGTISQADFLQGLDLILVFGGDGTVLAATGLAAPLGIPVLGINFGRVGFLTEAEPEELETVIERIHSGDSFIEERMMLEAVLPDGSREVALNDFAFVHRTPGKLLRADVEVGGQRLDRFVADGFLISTPTGSTAYALSCGGPVIEPSVECLLLCAICPHSLRSRPVVLPAAERVNIQISSPEAQVLPDGRGGASLIAGQTVSIGKAACTARFLRLSRRNYYALLQQKLSEWSQ